MRRRRFLTASGATLAGGALAGCTGSGPNSGGNGDSSKNKSKGGSGNATESTSDGTDDGSADSGGITTANGFQLVSAKVPKKVTMGKQFALKLTIKNVGDSSKAFESTVSVEGNAPGSQQMGHIQTDKIAPGKTTTWSTKLTYPYVATVDYHIAELKKTFSIDIVGETLSFGESFLSPNEIAVTVQDVTLTDHYRYKPDSGGSEDVEASDGSQWAFVTVKAENKFRMKQTLPMGNQFVLHTGGKKIKPTDHIAKEDGKYKVNKFGDRTVASGESLAGWLAYELPADVSEQDITIEWHGSDDEGSWWTRWNQ